MPLTVRLMRRQDIDQVTAIDHDAFPNEWPPTNFPRELDNKMAHYIVVYETPASDGTALPPTALPEKEPPPSFLNRVRGIFIRNKTTTPAKIEPEETILGFAGIWLLADEAHITSIASDKNHRHQGIGEALLVCIVELAQAKHARIVTLEARVSNTVAQNLYYKFGFDKLGTRKGYYLDNHEDAVIMSTEYISSPPYQEKFKQVKHACVQKVGGIHNQLPVNQ